MIQYQIFTEESLIILKLVGDCNFQELMLGIHNYMHDPDYQIDYKGVLDMRNGALVLTSSEVKQVSEFVHQQKFAKAAWCHIVEDPKSTALGMIYQNLIQDEHPLQVFSTVEAASEFLSIDLEKYINF